ncbi:Outer membrane protein assembly factor BamB [compost metagenome]
MYFGTAFTDKSVNKANIDAFFAVDLKTGKEKWRFAEAQSPILSTPIVADGVVFFTTLNGQVYALK